MLTSGTRRESYVARPETDDVEAQITGFTPDGQIAFAAAKDYKTVTFALSNDVWSGEGLPQIKEVVILSGMVKFRKGWRASKARRFVLADESKDSVHSEKN